ncbi:MAG: zinc/iron-chelating domain-containing protein [Desulfococcus sp. 4484_241]|nr:MAG: zinc/iron-chelating domain-containing protein [Desulfococcus sp. 4484_241]RLC30194.1 MAG: YkgJ family cysteine cluster protein [Deltaproteobacteria bacterium]
MPYKDSEPIFTCKKCGDCCKGYGGTFLTQNDIEAISRYLNIDTETFITNYCVMSGSRYLIAQGKDGYCIFWNGLCSIHPVKPRMCRAWPYIESVLVDVRNWEIMASMCPGMRTDVPPETIREIVKRHLENEKPDSPAATPARQSQKGKSLT